MGVFALQKWSFLNLRTPYLRKYRRRLVPGFICIVFTAVFVLATPYVEKAAAGVDNETEIQNWAASTTISASFNSGLRKWTYE